MKVLFHDNDGVAIDVSENAVWKCWLPKRAGCLISYPDFEDTVETPVEYDACKPAWAERGRLYFADANLHDSLISIDAADAGQIIEHVMFHDDAGFWLGDPDQVELVDREGDELRLLVDGHPQHFVQIDPMRAAQWVRDEIVGGRFVFVGARPDGRSYALGAGGQHRELISINAGDLPEPKPSSRNLDQVVRELFLDRIRNPGWSQAGWAPAIRALDAEFGKTAVTQSIENVRRALEAVLGAPIGPFVAPLKESVC